MHICEMQLEIIYVLFDVSMLKMDFIWQVSISSSFKFSQNDNFNILIVLETPA